MTYYHVEELEENREFNVDELDEKMNLCVSRISSGFSELGPPHNPAFISLVNEILKAFLATHKSVRLLLKQVANGDADYASDIMSLVREQVEKLFLITLLVEDPDKYLELYFKDGWRRLFKHKLLVEAEETKNLESFAGWKEVLETDLEEYRKVSGVSLLEKELVEYKFNKPGTHPPAHLNGVKVPQYPTPGQVKGSVTDAITQEVLGRWHNEYEYLCGYSHIGEEKIAISTLQKTRLTKEEQSEYVQKEIILPSLSITYSSIASACTEVWKYLIKFDADLTKSGDFLEAIIAFWEALTRLSFTGKLFWNLHAKKSSTSCGLTQQ